MKELLLILFITFSLLPLTTLSQHSHQPQPFSVERQFGIQTDYEPTKAAIRRVSTATGGDKDKAEFLLKMSKVYLSFTDTEKREFQSQLIVSKFQMQKALKYRYLQNPGVRLKKGIKRFFTSVKILFSTSPKGCKAPGKPYAN